MYRFGGPILSCISLIIVGLYPPSHIVFISPLPLPSLLGKWRLSLPQTLPRFAATRVAHPVPLMLLIKSPVCFGCSTCPKIQFWTLRFQGQYLVAWMSFPETSWKASRKETSEQTESTRDHDYTSITIHTSMGPAEATKVTLCQPHLVLKWWCLWSLCGRWLQSLGSRVTLYSTLQQVFEVGHISPEHACSGWRLASTFRSFKWSFWHVAGFVIG